MMTAPHTDDLFADAFGDLHLLGKLDAKLARERIATWGNDPELRVTIQECIRLAAYREVVEFVDEELRDDYNSKEHYDETFHALIGRWAVWNVQLPASLRFDGTMFVAELLWCRETATEYLLQHEGKSLRYSTQYVYRHGAKERARREAHEMEAEARRELQRRAKHDAQKPHLDTEPA